MKLNLRYTLLSLAFLASVTLLPQEASAEIKKLVTASNISATKEIADDHMPSNLVYDNNSKYHTLDDTPDMTFEDGPQYLQVDLGSPLSLGENEDLIVFIQRCQNCIVRQPTAFRVMGQMAGSDDWEPICYIYFLYRGKSTKEYSARFRPQNSYSKLRFYVTENNSRNYDANGNRSMGMRQFQVYQLDRNDTLDGMLDPVHLETDYKRDYANSKFIRTMGWLDERNRSIPNTGDNRPSGEIQYGLNNEAWDKGSLTGEHGYYGKGQTYYIEGINKWAKWTEDWNNNGEWNLDNAKLEEFGITMPKMSLITEDADFNAKTSPKDLERQPTHEMEHILYAVPGDPIILYPYYKFADALHYEKYEVNFAHWYDYRTGGRIIYDDEHGNKMDLLDFIADPSQICITNDHGFYGAYLLTEKNGNLPGLGSQNYGMYATFFCPRNPLDSAGNVKELPFRNIDIALGDNDVNEYVIAADFSQSFNKGRNLVTRKDASGKVVKDENGKDIVDIIEPNIAFRHIFRIRDGKQFAEEFSGSEEANINYTAQHSRKVMARAYREFQIGLDGGIPKPIKDGTWWRSAPSKYYYKVSETDCRRVGSMAIRVTRPDGTVETYSHSAGDPDPYNQNNLFYFDTERFPVGEGWDVPEFTGLGNRKIDGVLYGVGGGSVVEGEDLQYCRFLKSKQNLSGQYKVEIIGEEIIGHGTPQPIKVFGSNRDLVVMEYIIDFVNSEDDANPQALLVTGSNLYAAENDQRYGFAREETLISKYGEPKDKIDFDYYRYLEDLDNKDEYLAGENDCYRFKWPASWEKSNYGFGYSEGHNYNMYVVANNSSQTPYHNFWDGKEGSLWDGTKGLGDLLYWKTTNVPSNNTSATRAEGENNKGYFLYVNAANDPGVMITLNAGTLCTGSTINVSAWVAEFSKQPEHANIAFNLVAVLKGTGERINVHTYVSGYVDQPGIWTKIFYSFQPDVDHIGYSSSMIDHYEIELENNCKSSDGADYAIDEISIYIVTPEVGAEQEIPLCLDVYGKSAGNEDDEQEEEGTSNEGKITARTVKIFAPFKETLRSIGMSEATEEAYGEVVKVNYVIIDGEEFDKAYTAAKEDKTIEDPGAYAFAAPGVQLQGGELEEEEDASITFNSYFDKNPTYNSELGFNEVGTYLDERGNKMIAFRVNFRDDDYDIGKLYYIALYAQKEGDAIVPGWTQYDLTDPCSKACKFTVGGTNNIRIDGEIRNQNGGLKVCEGESPVISIDLAKQPTNKEENEPETEEGQENETETPGAEENETETWYKTTAPCDWYNGKLVDYQKVDETSGLSLYEAMVYFREAYPKATKLDGVKTSADFFTKAMLKLITDAVNEGKLVLSATQYQFKDPSGNVLPLTEDVIVTAIPMPMEVDGKDEIVCTAPMQINISVLNPTVLHGLQDVNYPEEIEDVPLRVGLDQLRSVSIEEEKANEASTADHPMLVIPLRKVAISGVVKDVTNINSSANSDGTKIGVVTLVSTTDPNPDLNPTTVESSSGEKYSISQEAGVIKSFTAVVGNDENTSDAGNKFSVLFYDSFPFREGYEYTFSYEFEEEMPADLEEDEKHICKGKDLFTIKVVPEYLVWTGSTSDLETEGEGEVGNGSGVNRNWNNDRNWKRVSSSDLNAELVNNNVPSRLTDKVTNGSNTNTGAFVPMDFTKVIIPASGVKAQGTNDSEGNATTKTAVLPPFMYEFTGTDDDAVIPTEAGKATKWIEYDMAAYSPESSKNVECKEWHANTCKEIHFLANSSIMNQQHLFYDKAWVDLELNPYRWYTLAMPLKKVFAGEFYLPSANGRQETELFQPIEFNTDLNHRFKPAVFQRGWDKGKATIYFPNGTSKDETAVVKANWSHVYNDVEESYGSGTGFSIKVDMSAVETASNENEATTSSADKTVLFRLPKADSFYDYYDMEGNVLQESHRKGITHGDDHYRLNPEEGQITAETAGEGDESFFLVGNPFMTYLDMEAFLKENEKLIEQKYWLVTSGNQKAAVFDETTEGFIGDAKGYVAPMQGFFVKAKDKPADNKLVLDYKASMMVDASAIDTDGVIVKTRSSYDCWKLSVTAENNGEASSTAMVIVDDAIGNGFDAANLPVLDNSDLEVRATVYTVGDGKALSVNRLEGIDKVELGVIALPDEETVLRFNTEDAAAGLKLYDAQTGMYTSIYDGLTYPITGNASGRLYLTASSDVAPVEASLISWSASGEEVTVRSNVEATDGVTVRVYDYAGRCVVSQSVADSELRFRVASGVYVLEAEAGAERLCVQIKI